MRQFGSVPICGAFSPNFGPSSPQRWGRFFSHKRKTTKAVVIFKLLFGPMLLSLYQSQI